MKADLYDGSGAKEGSVELNKTMFEAKINEDLMHRAVVMRQANARRPIAHTLNRGEIACSTRKIFRQKGTGNARRGAKSTNLLRGGGVTHGPRNDRNFAKSMPKKERRAALFSALSAKAKSSDVLALKSFESKTPKTKAFTSILAKLPEGKRYLFVLPEKNEIFQKSCNNIPGVATILASYLNPYDILLADKVCFLEAALQTTEDTFLTKAK